MSYARMIHHKASWTSLFTDRPYIDCCVLMSNAIRIPRDAEEVYREWKLRGALVSFANYVDMNRIDLV